MEQIASLIFEVGVSTRAAVESILERLRPLEDTAMFIDAKDSEHLGNLTAGAAISDLAAGRLTSVQWQSEDRAILWLEIHGPHRQAVPRVGWLLSFEFQGTYWQSLFEDLLAYQDVSFAVVSLEESLDFSFVSRDVSDFPWDHWRLVIAGIKRPPGEDPLRRRGRAFGRVPEGGTS